MIFSASEDSTLNQKFNLNCRGKLVDLSTPLVMGIINCTPDSFYKESRTQNVDAALELAYTHLKQGATFLDLGAYSTRPNATAISIDEELERIVPIAEALRKNHPNCLLSLDSFRFDVIKNLLPLGIDLVNDVSGLNDEKIAELIGGKNIPYILMHTSNSTSYKNIVSDVFQFFQQKITVLKKHQINDIIIDHGFGFGKTLDDNYRLLNRMSFFNHLPHPILIGVSRKSMIYKLLNISPQEALNGSTAIHTISLLKGAKILRVHDVKEAKECIDIFIKMQS